VTGLQSSSPATAPTLSKRDTVKRPTADDPQAETVTPWRVLPWDVDLFGHMNNSRYPLLMDFARVHYLRRAPSVSFLVCW
jgi:hypothetical protein